MITAGLLIGLLPFGFFMGIRTLTDIPSSDWRLLMAYIITSLILTYIISLGCFALIQRYNCGKLKNLQQINSNSWISVAIQAGIFAVIYLVPWFRNVIINLFPPDIDPAIRDSIAYSYYGFWSMLFGIAIGGSLSGSCAPKQID